MKRRNAFTLTELLVAIGIMIVIASLGLFIVAGRGSNQKVGDATELLQAKILIGRTKAFSEQTPRGLRILPGTVADGFMHRLVYIEQAPPLPLQGENGGNATVTPKQTSVYQVYLDTLDVSGGFSASDQWRVQAGDAFGFTQTGSQYGPYTIMETPTPDQSKPGWDLQIYVRSNQVAPPLSVPTANFTIIRANRPLAGEDPIDLPSNMGIDLLDTMPTLNGTTVTPQACSVIQADRFYFSSDAETTLAGLLPGDAQQLQLIGGASFALSDLQAVLGQLGISQSDWPTIMMYTGLYDILFAPDGSVLASAANGAVAAYPYGKVILWVCDTTGSQSQASNTPLVTPFPGSVDSNGQYVGNDNYKANARLIVIYTRTGFIAGHAVDRSQDPNGNYFHPFSFAQDGQPGGL